MTPVPFVNAGIAGMDEEAFPDESVLDEGAVLGDPGSPGRPEGQGGEGKGQGKGGHLAGPPLLGVVGASAEEGEGDESGGKDPPKHVLHEGIRVHGGVESRLLDLMPEEPSDAALVYKAQALTYRALGYYYLMNIYQVDYMHGGKDKPGVPLHLTVGGAMGRTPSTEVYSTIITDLQNAIKTFEEQGYDPMSSTADIDQSVANMLLARIALTSGDYSTAASAAAAVIAEPYSLMNEEQYTSSGFLDASLPETIWAYTWSSATSTENVSFASWISIYCNYVGMSNNRQIYFSIDERLYNQIPDTDYRKNNFMPVDYMVFPAYSNFKFYNETYYTDEIYMRLSEAYLLKAEAEARGGNDAAAQQTLYDLVSQRDSGYTKSTNTGDALLDEIYLQSRIELWGEGHEFYTNKRFNKGVDRTSSANHTHKVVKAAGKEFTYQIPLSIEINSNPYINDADQNPL